MWKTIMNLYNTSTVFHSLVIAVEMAVVSFATSYSGGLPTSRAGWVSLAFAFGGAIWAAIKRWLATNVATKQVPLKP